MAIFGQIWPFELRNGPYPRTILGYSGPILTGGSQMAKWPYLAILSTWEHLVLRRAPILLLNSAKWSSIWPFGSIWELIWEHLGAPNGSQMLRMAHI